ncbi:hypothetical protein J3R83DRAFT_8216 [Lanmaoa asiatica]|nr:hypothetical protein J3R83DRAFT_8216 [Lanmaoa asiatica]
MYVRPDRPLVVKCTFDRWNKHISFASAKNCSYDLLKNKIEQCFSLYATPYVISYKDDDGEVTDISTESDLTEAIQYFQAGSDDPPLSSAASILSGRSFGSKRRITLRVHITVDYDGPSLSDTSSLASLEEYKGRNKSNGELSWTEMGPTGELEDDSSHTAASPFEHVLSVSARDRGAAWLRDQNARTIKAMLGATPEPSESDSRSVSMSHSGDQRSQENIDGDLALQRDPRGSIKDENEPSASSSSGHVRPNSMQLSWLTSQQKVYDEDPAGDSTTFSSTSEQIPFTIPPDIPPEVLHFLPPPPGTLTTCSECGVLLDAIRYVCAMCGEKEPTCNSLAPSELNVDVGKGKERSLDFGHSYPPSPHQTFQLPFSMSPPEIDSMLWNSSPHSRNEHPNKNPLSCLPSSTLTLCNPRGPGHLFEPENIGYELCSGCIEAAGIYHALCASTERVGSIGSESTSPEDVMSLWTRSAPRHKGQLRHAYFEKVWGHQGWDDVEQEDMLTCRCSTCNTTITGKRYKCASCKKFNLCRACYRYLKISLQLDHILTSWSCVSSQVHDIHPAHAFLLVMEKPTRSKNEPEYLPTIVTMQDTNEEQSMKHPGVKCMHCLQDILGARFHCAICDSVDICANCESAGLPGNLDSSDGGHLSSHIMIKIPYPLETQEVQTASRRAIHLWTGRDAAHVLTATHSKPSSVYSSYAQTVVGSRMHLVAQDDPPEDHRIICDGCHEVRARTRISLQFAHERLFDRPFSERDINVQRAPRHLAHSVCVLLVRSAHICSMILCTRSSSFLGQFIARFNPPLGSCRSLYKVPAGPVGGLVPHADPKEYLSFLVHSTALCDRCLDRICGAWFRCAYCAKDLCGDCEALDTHDETHLFIVFKAPVDMPQFRQFANLENPAPIIPFPVYW